APYLRVGYCDHNEKCGQRIAPRWSPGDRIWVKETFCNGGGLNIALPGDGLTATGAPAPQWIYRADETFALPRGTHWKPSIFMPRAASRITLEIQSVRVERLQEISEQDAWAEGVTLYGTTRWETESRQAYKLLWESINGAGSWEKNPWVWIL